MKRCSILSISTISLCVRPSSIEVAIIPCIGPRITSMDSPFLNFCINTVLIGILTYNSFVDNIELNSSLFLRLLLIFTASVLFKILVELGVGYLFDLQKLFHSYVFQQVSSLNFLGIVLLLLNSILIYGVPNNRFLLIFILSISGLILLIGMFKSIKLYQKLLINNLFYFILYLCALEIGPYIILCNLFS